MKPGRLDGRRSWLESEKHTARFDQSPRPDSYTLRGGGNHGGRGIDGKRGRVEGMTVVVVDWQRKSGWMEN